MVLQKIQEISFFHQISFIDIIVRNNVSWIGIIEMSLSEKRMVLNFQGF